MACQPTSPLTGDHNSPQPSGVTFVISSTSPTTPQLPTIHKPMVWWNVSTGNSKQPYVHVLPTPTGFITCPGYSSASVQLLLNTPTSPQLKLCLAVNSNYLPSFLPLTSPLPSQPHSFPTGHFSHLLPHSTIRHLLLTPLPISLLNSKTPPMSWSEKT